MKLPRASSLLLTSVFAFMAFALVPTAARAQAYCVNKSGAKLRKTASTSAPTTWQVPRYMPLAGTGNRKAGFIEVSDVDGETHWVSGREVTTTLACVTVKAKISRLRLGPGKSFQASPLGIADRYTSFVDLGGEEGWTQVQDEDGEKAWVSLDHLWKPLRRTRMSFDRQ